MNTLLIPLSVLILAPAATAQIAPHYVSDTTDDAIWRCVDLNSDGDVDDAGEVVTFYDDLTGSLMLSNNSGLHTAPDGTVYVCDTTEDCVFKFRDGNADGDANDPGEHAIWFDGRVGGNASNVALNSASNLVYQASSGAWFASSSNTGTAGTVDAIIRMKDLNSDGDANDLGEASEYWIYTATTGTGDSILSAVEIGADDNVYFFDTGSVGLAGKGVYRLVDLNADGDANDAGEVAPFFIPTATIAVSAWSLALGTDGWFYTADTGNDVIWRFRDLNADGDAMDPGEGGIWWTVGATSLIWNIAIAPDGALYALESTTPQRTIRLFDADANGSIGAGEFSTIYNETASPAVIGTGRAIDFVIDQAAGTPFCFGDGSGTACPCGNAGAAGNGCANSLFAAGARLSGQGLASVANDTLSLIGSQMPNSSALYFQGTAPAGSGLGLVFGDGLRCAGGSVIRLGTKFNVAGSSSYPGAGDQPVSVRGLNAPGDVRHYQIWYRNAAAFCTTDTFNLTNGLGLTWAP